jgi:hypothetical protein
MRLHSVHIMYTDCPVKAISVGILEFRARSAGYLLKCQHALLGAPDKELPAAVAAIAIPFLSDERLRKSGLVDGVAHPGSVA